MNVYEIVTEKIVKMLEAGNIPWKKPWVTGYPKNGVSRKEYRGINSFLLSLAPFQSPYWLTYKQAQGFGGNVKKGEKAWLVTFFKMLDGETEVVNGIEKTDHIPMLRYYNVFNVEQCENLDMSKFSVERRDIANNPIEAAEKIVSAMPLKPEIRLNPSQAMYSPLQDYIGIPAITAFDNSEMYYATLFHEMTHSTGHKSRLGRDIEKCAAFGSADYSKEELIAEMGAAFLNNICGISEKTDAHNAAYCQSWIKRLKNDTRMVVQAASKAQKAADFIQGK